MRHREDFQDGSTANYPVVIEQRFLMARRGSCAEELGGAGFLMATSISGDGISQVRHGSRFI
jgi:hypothetical protein